MAAIISIIAMDLLVTISITVMPSLFQMLAFPAVIEFIVIVIKAVLANIPSKVIFPVVPLLMFSVLFLVMSPRFEMFVAPARMMFFCFMVTVGFSMALMMPFIEVMGK